MVQNDGNLIDEERFRSWFGQARHTFESALRDLDAGDYAWASFKAQQGAEFALKALGRALGQPVTGHALLRLVEQLDEAGMEELTTLMSQARALDRHYIPPRYPDAYSTGSPFEFYDEETAQKAVDDARTVLDTVEQLFKQFRGSQPAGVDE